MATNLFGNRYEPLKGEEEKLPLEVVKTSKGSAIVAGVIVALVVASYFAGFLK